MKLYIVDWKNNQKKVSKKEAELIVGAKRLEEMISEGKAFHEEDPFMAIEFMIHGGRLMIEFE
jgi:hypothetical protein